MNRSGNSARMGRLLATGASLAGLLGLRGLGLGGAGIETELGDDLVGSRLHAALDVASPEFRKHRALEDDAGKGVGEDRLQPIADLDADLVLGGDDDEDRPVVGPLLADPPGSPELVAIVLDGVAAERGQGDDDQLPAGLGLQGGEFAGEVLLDLG